MERHPYHKDADELSALRRLYPELSDLELRAVQETLDRYVLLIARITDRILSDPRGYAELLRRLAEERKKKGHGHADKKA